MAMLRQTNRVFRVSYRVQAAGVVSVVAVPVMLAAITLLLLDVSPWLAVGVGAAFLIGVQATIAKRWTGSPPRPVSPRDAPQIHAIVERLCTAGDLDKPKIVLHSKRYANSWITGLTLKRTTLHLTSRLVELLDEPQLEAVIAHELSHVGQKDSILMSAVGAPVAAMLDGAGLYFHTPRGAVRTIRAIRTTRATLASQARVERDQTERNLAALSLINSSLLAVFIWLLLFPVGFLFLVVGETSRTIAAVFSRARELEADAGAARLTGRPSALASALMVLGSTPSETIPLIDLRKAANLDVFHIVAVGKEHTLAHTHPPLRRRLEQLSEIETRLQNPGLE